MYSKAEKLLLHGRGLVGSKWNFWELDLDAGRRSIFYGEFDFYGPGFSEYLTEDVVVINGAHSYKISHLQDNLSVFVVDKKNNLLLKVGDGLLYSSYNGRADKHGNIYLIGSTSSEGSMLRQFKSGRNERSWKMPMVGESGMSFFGSAVDPEGKYFIQSIKIGKNLNKKLMKLNLESGEWSEVLFPASSTQMNK